MLFRSGRTTLKANENGKKLLKIPWARWGQVNREEGRPPHLIREVVTVPDEVGAQGAGAVLRGCRLLVHAQEDPCSELCTQVWKPTQPSSPPRLGLQATRGSQHCPHTWPENLTFLPGCLWLLSWPHPAPAGSCSWGRCSLPHSSPRGALEPQKCPHSHHETILHIGHSKS